MSNTFNQQMLVGVVTQDPEVKFLPNGTGVVSFSVVTNHYNSKTKKEDIACFHNITSFRENHVNFSKFIHVGDLVLIIGEYRTRTYDAKDGSKRYGAEVIANTLTKLNDGKISRELRANGEGGASVAAASNAPVTDAPALNNVNTFDDGDLIPF